ncbi:insulin-like growth factor-binding protein 3 [Austrofundulus limnaeus]|uniref:Insulin-like growth factor-binding protein 3 n=1 Tax=Austrofundulus limnaeus TaxID=52670 RepID=A0A2I4BA95_AUSLI|nr:PREDICTED: insulin-like growth factor-binding protein 6 [Austrofundulus limnaeus]
MTFLSLNILVLLLSKAVLAGVLTSSLRACPTCKGKQVAAGENTTALPLGEPCGVYTLKCAHGLRCEPPQDEPRSVRALLEGRGVCSNVSTTSTTSTTTTQVQTEDLTPTQSPSEAPCRKLLTTLTKGLSAQVFKSHHEIYVPNCDRSGYFKKKQCWSSRGRQRGRCWCVDENGVPVTPKTKQRGSVSC